MAEVSAAPRLARSCDQIGFGDTTVRRRGIAKRNPIDIAAADSLIACRSCSAPKLQSLTSIAFEAIASILCGRYFFRQFFVTHDACRDRRQQRIDPIIA